jgi:hypothetical protein
MWQWCGNLFYRGQSISDIYNLSYFELKMWNEWHEMMEKAEKKAIEQNHA